MCPGAPYKSFMLCPAIVPGAEELKGRSFRGGVVAHTKWRTVLFEILPKVHNWKKNLWPVRNPGCGGKCFLGWGKQASCPVSCLRHGWTNMHSLAEKWLWWKILRMDSYLLIFRITQVPFFRGFRKTILMGSEQPYAIKAAGVLGQAKFYSGDLNFLNPVSAI